MAHLSSMNGYTSYAKVPPEEGSLMWDSAKSAFKFMNEAGDWEEVSGAGTTTLNTGNYKIDTMEINANPMLFRDGTTEIESEPMQLDGIYATWKNKSPKHDKAIRNLYWKRYHKTGKPKL